MNPSLPPRLRAKINESVEAFHDRLKFRPKIALVLGSGLGQFGELLDDAVQIDASSIPHYPRSVTVGHNGKLIIGKLNGVPLLCFQGRVHFYESGDLSTVLYPMLVAHGLGITQLILTNAAGGTRDDFTPGDFMIIDDHINLTFRNPLRPIFDEQRSTPYIHSGEIYDREIRKIIRDAASAKGVPIRSGVYCAVLGPSYETAAEINMVRKIGGDAVGMSTVNEASLAHSLGMRVAGISCITNLSTGISSEKLSHDEVTEVANRVKPAFAKLLMGVIERIARTG
jgi:purine-nucleoside phosphorylase